MKWLSHFSGHKATRWLLKLQQYHVNHDQHHLPRLYHVPNPLGLSKSMELPSLFSREKYSTSNKASLNDVITKRSKHLKESLSHILTQFYPIAGEVKDSLQIVENSQSSSSSLSETAIGAQVLPLFYWHAKNSVVFFLGHPCSFLDGFVVFLVKHRIGVVTGSKVSSLIRHLFLLQIASMVAFKKTQDSLQIECNDKGVYYIEARVNQTLEDFLSYPDDEKVRALNPESPRTVETSIGNFVIGIQVNIFNCGGIGLSTSLSHKIFDGHTYFTFMKAWAAAARGSPEIHSPSFVAYEVFPNNPYLEFSMPASKLMTTKLLSTKRFLFNSTALARLKSQSVACSSASKSLNSRGPTRIEATSAVIWKVAAKVASNIRPFGPQSPHLFVSSVNLRKRASPPLPNESIGNIVDPTVAICFPESQPD
ncbi:putative vinorine synthase [Tanacetum coccineum]